MDVALASLNDADASATRNAAAGVTKSASVSSRSGQRAGMSRLPCYIRCRCRSAWSSCPRHGAPSRPLWSCASGAGSPASATKKRLQQMALPCPDCRIDFLRQSPGLFTALFKRRN